MPCVRKKKKQEKKGSRTKKLGDALKAYVVCCAILGGGGGLGGVRVHGGGESGPVARFPAAAECQWQALATPRAYRRCSAPAAVCYARRLNGASKSSIHDCTEMIMRSKLPPAESVGLLMQFIQKVCVCRGFAT